MAVEQHVDPDASVDEPGRGAGARTMGVERWVQLAFLAFAVVGFLLFENIVAAIWDLLAAQVPAVPEPNETLTTAIAAALSIVIFFVLYKNATVHRLSHEIAQELAQVTWPSRKETWAATVVVIVTSTIAALIMFFYDAVWSALTDLVY